MPKLSGLFARNFCGLGIQEGCPGDILSLMNEEGWIPKNWCFWTVVLEKTLETPLDCKEIKPINPKRKQSWMFIGRTDAEAETAILWPPDMKNWLLGKDPDAGKDWGQEEKGMTEDEMVGQHHWVYGHESEWTPGVGDGQGGLACCGPWGCEESYTTDRLNWTEHREGAGILSQRIFCWLSELKKTSPRIIFSEARNMVERRLIVWRYKASLLAQMVKNPPVMQETWA